MNRITRKSIGALGASMLAMVTLAGCGGGPQATVKNGEYDAKQPITASQAFKQKSIWYLSSTDDIGKDSTVDNILVFDGAGNITSYYADKLTFGDLRDKSDDEITALAKQEDKQHFDTWRESTKSQWNEEYQNRLTKAEKTLREKVTDNPQYNWNYSRLNPQQKAEWDNEKLKMEQDVADAKSRIARLDEYFGALEYTEPKPSTYYLRYSTDQTGNNTARETISYTRLNYAAVSTDSYESWMETGKAEIPADEKDSDLKSVSPTQVYDMWFGGYERMVTKIKQDGVGFTLDKPGTDGVSEERN